MRYEEVVVFTCGLMKDPKVLIRHISKKFNEMNTGYLSSHYIRVPEKEKEPELKRLGKTAVNLEFFRLVWAESRAQLPWSPLQNPYFNWFDHERDDQHGLARDKSSVCIPSEYYSFQNLKEPISSHNIQEHEQFGQCSIVIDNPHPDVVDSLLSTCSTICKHQAVANLCLFNLRIKNTAIENIFKLSSNAEFLAIENCILPSNMVSCLLQQISVCSTLKGIRLQNNTIEEPGKSLIHLSDSIQNWSDNNELKYLVILNCSLLPDQCSSLLQSLSTCSHLTYLNLSENTVGSGGKHLAESIRNWGINPPLKYLYLHNCGLNEDDCTEILQSLLGCGNLKEISISRNTIGKTVRHLVEAIHKLSSYGKLEKLYLSDCSFPEDQCAAILTSLSLCKQLTCLNLSNNRIQNAGKDLLDSIKQWGVNPPLQELYLSNCGLHEDDCAELLQSLSGCGNLKEIDLSGNSIGKAAKYLVEVIQTLSSYGKLEKLYLSDCSFPEDQCAAILQALSLSKQLTVLDMSDIRIQNAGKDLADSIKQWDTNPPLQALYLHNCGLHEDDCVALLQSLLGCSNLVEVNLSGNTIGKAAKYLVEVVQTLSSYGKLKKLGLSDCSFAEDQCAAILKSLSLCKQLTVLDLSKNKLVTSGKHLADSIKKMGINPPLECLYLNSCGLHQDDCAALLQSLLECINLREVNLSGNNIGESARHLSKVIKTCGNNQGLQNLYLKKCQIPDYFWGEIVKTLALCKNLTSIYLDHNPIRDSTRVILQLAHSIRQWGNNPPLQNLNLYEWSMSESVSCELISSLSSCTNLTTLALTGSRLCEEGLHLKRYLETITDTLETLCLDGCSIPLEVSHQIISVLSGCKNLRHMSLPGNTLTGTLSSFNPNPHLEHLDLGDAFLNKEDMTNMTDFVQSHKLPKLGEVCLLGSGLDKMENEIETLIDAVIKHHQRKLTIFLCRNNMSAVFVMKSTTKCIGTKLTLDFNTDIDDYHKKKFGW